jgi:hypothetical protein
MHMIFSAKSNYNKEIFKWVAIFIGECVTLYDNQRKLFKSLIKNYQKYKKLSMSLIPIKILLHLLKINKELLIF